ncbi:MAG TPA: orotidine-5'-phosphate decarboxylase [Pseudomonadales bacterium]|nr:orotidine-5'-phosphate decarboxylase [Pseudomonadales bacterium]
MKPSTDSKIIVALDYPDLSSALNMAEQLDPAQCKVKVGKELFTATGPVVVKELTKLGFKIFLDLKFHDIPNTTARACAVAADLGVWMLNVHASGGRQMMEHCANTLESYGPNRPRLIAVTVLTSLDAAGLKEIGFEKKLDEQVLLLTRLAEQSGLDGVVCSAQESRLLRQHVTTPFLLVTPGIRPSQVDHNDQKRTMTPVEALSAGVNYLVIGRPITQAADPKRVLDSIDKEINQFISC